MRKFIVSTIAVLVLLGTGVVSASALVQEGDLTIEAGQPPNVPEPVDPVPADPMPVDPVPVDPVPVEPEPIAPLPYGSVHLRGDVFGNGVPFGPVDFAILWNEDDPSEAELWALLEGVPTQACTGRIFETPAGEPIFFGETSLMGPAATCHMSRLPDHSGISLFAAASDGQWVSSIMRYVGQVEPVPIFG